MLSRKEMEDKLDDYCEELCCSECKLLDSNCNFHSIGEETLKENYELVFGTSKFTLSDIKSGYLCKIKDGTLLLVIPTDDDYWDLCDEDMCASTTKDEYNLDMTDKDSMSEFDIIEVYGYTTTDYSGLFNTSNRELLYKREEVAEEVDINTKEYQIDGFFNLRIAPEGKGYGDADSKPIFIEIYDNNLSFTSISIDSAKQLIKSLQEIVDYVEGDK